MASMTRPLPPDLAWAAFLVAAWFSAAEGQPGAPSLAPVEPAAVIGCLRRNGVPLLTLAADRVPRPPMLLATPAFQVALEEDRRSLVRQTAAFVEIRAAWARAGIPALFVKAAGPPPSFTYTSSNLDILVPQARQHDARKLARDLGYVELRHIEEPNKFLFRRYHLGAERLRSPRPRPAGVAHRVPGI